MPIDFKPYLQRVKERKHYTDDLGDEFLDGGRTFTIEDKLTAPEFGAYFVKEMASGADFSLAYFQEHGFEEPLLFKDKTNLGMRYVYIFGIITYAYYGTIYFHPKEGEHLFKISRGNFLYY